MSLLQENRPAYNQHLALSIAVEDALSTEREQAKEILKERYWSMLDKMSTASMAELIVNESTVEQIRELHQEMCGGLSEDKDERQTAGVIYGGE